MILAASLEFEKGHNSEITERPSDNEEIPIVSVLLKNTPPFFSTTLLLSTLTKFPVVLIQY